MCNILTGLRNNLALNRPAEQSSTFWSKDIDHADADRAVDGNRNQIMAGKSCSQTKSENNPWWAVSLASTINVGVVAITTRGDSGDEGQLYSHILLQ